MTDAERHWPLSREEQQALEAQRCRLLAGSSTQAPPGPGEGSTTDPGHGRQRADYLETALREIRDRPWLDNALDPQWAAGRATAALSGRWMRAVQDDPYGLWRAGDIAEDLGWESDHPDAPRIRVLRLMPSGQEITPANWRTAFTPIAQTGEQR